MGAVHIIGGGTFNHVRAHFALSAPAFGGTARWLHSYYAQRYKDQELYLHLTRMAGGSSTLETNHHVGLLLDQLVADPDCRVVYMNAALCDYEGSVMGPGLVPTPSGKLQPRLRTSEGTQVLQLRPAEKMLRRLRAVRKDLFLVAFKATCGATPDQQYAQALGMLKAASANLVLANDVQTGHCMVVAPEETRYFEGDREHALRGLVSMVQHRRHNTFTRSTVLPGDLVPFQTSPAVPQNLRQVVNYLVERGAYKPFRGATVGHFAVSGGPGHCYTSRRKTDYTKPGGLDLVQVHYSGDHEVLAHGAKPSVGGQSQRLVFQQHPDRQCIVHFHCPLRDPAPDMDRIAVDNDQWARECGSHQCGQAVARNLPAGELTAVMLQNHGPNVVFGEHVPATDVIDFIERNFVLSAKTGGLVPA